MTSPIERAINASVRCIKCGVQGVGTCNCGRLFDAERRGEVIAGEVVEALLADGQSREHAPVFAKRFGARLAGDIDGMDVETRLAYAEGLMRCLHELFNDN
ncbi:hypothetical protein POK33_37695 [Burkholderia cenocepacia]|uniref:hypothetical protein n=1 Tax=Burkholderia cenocepacia TaxID=95486 RepID=UPI0023B8A332|nr:hypothetical protein [Burkholderia cenocepacia]MDF0506491.1 hypothetical protein [Burkholderia cenocepacia]